MITPLTDVADCRKPGTCALTFDDGRRSVVDVVHPVLRERDLPYTVFLCTSAVDDDVLPWFVQVDHLVSLVGMTPLVEEWGLDNRSLEGATMLKNALKEIPLPQILAGLLHVEKTCGVEIPPASRMFMTSRDVQRLASEGVSFESHTHRHPILSKLGADDQRYEVERSRDEIEAIVGKRPTQFAYPNGTQRDFDSTTMSILRQSGFTHAYTTVHGHLSDKDDPLALPRVGLEVQDGRARRSVKRAAPWISRSHSRELRLRERVAATAEACER